MSQVKRGDAYIYFTATSAPGGDSEDGSTYTMDPMTEIVDLTISLKRPKQSSTNANGCETTTSSLCTAIGVT